MPATSQCPEAEVLERLHRGQVTLLEVETIGEHLLQCGRCAELAGSVPAGDELIAAARAGVVPTDEALQARIGALIARLRDCQPPIATPIPEATGQFPPPAAPVTETNEGLYDFLGPAQEADEIGRLG